MEDDDGVQGKGNSKLKSVSRVLRFLEDNGSTGSSTGPAEEESSECELTSRSSSEVRPDLRDTRSDIENDCGGGNEAPVSLAEHGVLVHNEHVGDQENADNNLLRGGDGLVNRPYKHNDSKVSGKDDKGFTKHHER